MGTVKSQTARALARLRELLGARIDAELDGAFEAGTEAPVEENGTEEGARR